MAEKQRVQSGSYKAVLASVLPSVEMDALWVTGYMPAFAISFRRVDLGSILPALLYMFRRGVRRGAGKFHTTYRGASGAVTVLDIVNALLADGAMVHAAQPAYALLADYLLCTSFENKNHALSRSAPVIRAYANHYLSAWIDLPRNSIDLRLTPELLLTTLAWQSAGEHLTWQAANQPGFAMTDRYADNNLLRVLGSGMQPRNKEDLMETWDESAQVDVEQLVCIRVAQRLGNAPSSAADGKKGAIENRWPVAVASARRAGDDVAVFLRAYADAIPRTALLPMLEACFGLGLSTMFLDSMQRLSAWSEDGRLPLKDEDALCTLFVDCSYGADAALRAASETCADERLRGVAQFTYVLAQLRILDRRARARRLHEGFAIAPDPTAWINLLGDLLHGRHEHSEHILEPVEEMCGNLGAALQDEPAAEELCRTLAASEASPVRRFAAALSQMMGYRSVDRHVFDWADSVWRTNSPDGMARSRRRRDGNSRRMVRSFVLSDVLLDYLVHRYLIGEDGSPRRLSLREFLRILRVRYGLYVDQAPPGQSIAHGMLAHNRRILEERLRDLGLLVSVNDADGMKFLRPRFAAAHSGGQA